MPPGVHPAPADLALGRQPLAMVPRDRRGLFEGLGDLLLIGLGVLRPVRDGTGRIDADDSVRSDAQLAEGLGDPACLANRGEIVLPLAVIPHRRPVEPDRRDHRSDHEPFLRDLAGDGLEVVVADVDVDVRVVEEDVDSVELGSVNLRRGGQVEHGIQVDGRLGARAPLADESGPHRVMQLRVFVRMAATHEKPLSRIERNRRFFDRRVDGSRTIDSRRFIVLDHWTISEQDLSHQTFHMLRARDAEETPLRPDDIVMAHEEDVA